MRFLGLGVCVTTILMAAMPAGASSILAGQTINVTYYDPDLSTVYVDFGTAVAPFTFAGVPLVEVNVAITDYNITFTFNETAFFTCCRPYNGFVITDETSAPFTWVGIDPATDLSGFTNANVTFTADQIFVNWPGLNPATSTIVALDLAPEPATFGLLGIGLGALPLMAYRRRRLQRRFRSGSARHVTASAACSLQ